MLRLREPLAAVLLAAVLVPPAAAAAPADVVVLDPVPPGDAAAYSGTLAWLRPDPPDARSTTRSLLVVRRGGTISVLPTQVPHRTGGLTLGTDARERLTVVLVTRSGLMAVRLDEPTRLRRVPGTRRGDHSPGLRHGLLTFVRDRPSFDTLHRGSLRSAKHRLIWRSPWGVGITDTTVGARGRIAFQTFWDDEYNSTHYELNLFRADRPPRRLHALFVDDGIGTFIHGMGRATLGADGTRISVSRFSGSGPNDTTDFSLRDGRKLSSHRHTRLPAYYFEIPLGREGAAAVPVAGLDDGKQELDEWGLQLLPG